MHAKHIQLFDGAAALLVAALTLFSGAAGAQQSGPPVTVDGTYDLFICRDGCKGADYARAYVFGRLVLRLDTIAIREIPAAQRRHFEFARPMFGGANGCFALYPLHKRSDSYAGIEPAGLIHWRRDSTGTVRLNLYQSPDAWYVVALNPGPEELRGHGTSFGAGAAEIHAPADSVLARRIGAPDLGPCITAVPPGR